MLDIEFRTPKGDVGKIVCHIGDRVFKYGLTNAGQVTTINASGHELQLILNRLVGIPYSKSPVTEWSGEMAQFIIANIVYEFEKARVLEDGSVG